MQYRKFDYLVMFLIIISLLLSGCSPTLPAPPTSDDTLPATTRIPASRYPSTPILLSATKTPPATPDSTPTITVSPVPASATPHPIPTPPGDEATEQVLWLFETNNGCQLPCWWGITPGETEWSTAEEFFNTFVPSVYISSSTPDQVVYEPVIPLPTTVFAEERMNLGVVVRNGIVEYINSRVSIGNTPPGYLTTYLLPEFLGAYGQPAEVWLSTYPAAFENNELPFVIVLFYPEQGIAVLYFAFGSREGEIVRGCPQQGPASFLSLWHAPLNYAFADIQKRAAVYNADFLALEEATALDVNTFYETFKDADNTTCLETPAALW